MNQERDLLYVLPEGSHWEIKRGKDASPMLFYFSKDDAVAAGKKIARDENCELIIEAHSQRSSEMGGIRASR